MYGVGYYVRRLSVFFEFFSFFLSAFMTDASSGRANIKRGGRRQNKSKSSGGG